MADGALMAAPSPPQQSTTPEQAHKTAVPPTPSRLKWFGSQITEDNLNVDYVSNSLREEDRKPDIVPRPRPQPRRLCLQQQHARPLSLLNVVTQACLG